ncbi:pseudouridine synthase [Peloplasma aerotolerans]|jgi:23S rRNA pseudouridine2605 synthase|uniref:Pseudouridine synthase n=1 Tax=Peloplasma aerotolerans TaxID=3044389 RepID=A0AAW6U767_9MOLU|nr:pseudouridine synthase [Mariniplasma sp. M4Ah]MDI6452337.1 pseudouridine synthase [Mariniplasma sp. M4Ah]
MERLQKVLAQANIASRRKSEEIILEGRVKVNGVVVSELGFKVDKKDKIEVDGKPIELAEHLYFLLNKPTGYVSTTSDEKNRKTVIDLLDDEHKNIRLYPVGRLDFDTAGLLLLTNDGDFTNRLTHPEHEVEKEYLARVEGIVIRKKIVQLRKGVRIDDNYLAIPKAVQLVELNKVHQSTLLSITLTEGRNKQVRKMFEAIGHPVKKLTRVRYDFLTLDGVERGTYRPLRIHEVKKLYGNTQSKK